MRLLPLPEFAVAQLHFLPIVIEDVKRLRRLREKVDIDERRVTGEHRATPFDPDIQKNIGRARQHEIRCETKSPKHQPFQDTVPASMGGDGDHFNQCSCDSEPPASERHN